MDADAATGHQVDLEVGANTIKVKVTSADTTVTQTYTLTVTRLTPRAREEHASRRVIVRLTSATITNGADRPALHHRR